MAEGGEGGGGGGGNASSELVVATIPEDQKHLVCVEYPGFVDNDDRAIASLGGTESLAKVHFEMSQRLEARLRPEDTYCKPVFARTNKVSNLVLRVKRRRRKRTVEEEGEDKAEGEGERCLTTPGGMMLQGDPKPDYEYSAEVVGVVNTSYTFPGMADFQVLPPGLSSVSHNHLPINPEDFQITGPLDDSFVNRDHPSFLPPSIFSKFDKPTNYGFRSETKAKLEPKEGQMSQGRHRKFMTAYAIPFDYKGTIPAEPHPNALNSSYVNHPKVQFLKQLFEERPIWSRLALDTKVKLPQSLLRSLLALVAYNITSGPWRTLWVKFGYDPRADPSSKVYQCLDFRLPKDVDIVEARSRMGVRFQSGHSKSQLEDGAKLAEEKPSEEETAYIFTANQLPSQRQLFYQLCDLREEELQRIVHSNDGRETECLESCGWCEENTYEKLRRTLVDLTKKTAERIKAGEPSGSTTQPSDGATS